MSHELFARNGLKTGTIVEATTGGGWTFSGTGEATFPASITGSTLVSNVSTGTAPLTITSTTVVTNLNADKLDDQDGSYYLNPANLSSSVPVSKGGTGLTSTTQYALYVGGSGAMAQLATGTSGYVLVSGGAAGNPTWTQYLGVASGGSGAGTFTAKGILYGNGTSAFGVTAAPTANQVLVSVGGANPSWTAGALPVTHGGTGVATLTGIPVASGTSNFSAVAAGAAGALVATNAATYAFTAAGAAGNILISSGTTTSPTFITPTAGTNTTVTANGTTLSWSLDSNAQNAVTLRHTQNTDTGTTQTSFSIDSGSNPAQSGTLRMPRNGSISVRNATNNGDVTCLSFDGTVISANSLRISNVVDPSSAQDAATKAYVDSVAQGLAPKNAVWLKSDSNINVATGGLALTIDSIACNTAGRRVLLVGQSTPTEDGVWVTSAGAWTRASDFAIGVTAGGYFVFVEAGTTYHDTGWVCSNDPGGDVVGTNNLDFVQFSSAGTYSAALPLSLTGSQFGLNYGNGLTLTGNNLVVNLGTNPGLSTTSGLVISLGTDPALTTTGGLGVLLNSTNPGLSKSGGLKVLLDATAGGTGSSSGLGVGSSGLYIDLATSSGLTLSAGGITCNFGTAAGTVAQGNDSRLAGISISSAAIPNSMGNIDTTTVSAISTVIWDYVIYGGTGTNHRAGRIWCTVDTSSGVEYTEECSLDVGSTSGVSLQVVNTSGNVALQGASTAGSWTLKFRRTII